MIRAHNIVQKLIDGGEASSEELRHVLNVLDKSDNELTNEREANRSLAGEVVQLRGYLQECQEALEDDKPQATIADVERLFRESVTEIQRSVREALEALPKGGKS